MSNPGIPAQAASAANEVPTPVVEAVAPVIAPVAPLEPVSSVAAVTPTSGLQAPIVVEAPVVAPTPEPAPAVVPEALVAPVEAPKTVLGSDPEIPEIKSAVEPIAPVVETVEGQSVEPAPPPKYEPYKLPEGITLEDDKVNEFNNILSELEVKGKAEHAEVQDFGQKAIDFHIKEVQKILQNRDQQEVVNWEAQKTAWKDQFLADPEIGGNRFQTTVDSAMYFLRTHGGTQEQQAEFRKLMDTSGLGNHPAMIRLFAKAGVAMSEGRPLAANKPIAPPKSKTETMYGKK